MSDNVDDYRCPLTLEIFTDPVVAMDGYIYERTAIVEWFKNNKNSPITRSNINDNTIDCFFVKNSINQFLEKNPQYIGDRFRLTFGNNVDRVKRYINDNDFWPLTGFHQYSLRYLMDNLLLKKIFSDCKNENILKYLINDFVEHSSGSLNFTGPNGNSLMHYACKYSTPMIIMYLIDRGVSISLESHKSKRRAIHVVCKYGNPDIIKLLINLSDNLECETIDGWRPIHYLCRYSTEEMITYIMSRGVSLLSKTKSGDSVLSNIDHNSILSENDKLDLKRRITDVIRSIDESYEEIDRLLAAEDYDKLLKFRSFDLDRMISNGSLSKLFQTSDDLIIEAVLHNCVDINCESDQRIRPIHLISKYGSPYIVNYALQLNIDAETPSIGGWKPIHYALKYQTLPAIMLLINYCKDFRSITDDGSSAVTMIKDNSKLTTENKNLIAVKILERMRNT